ncbi:MAG: hypothetical protein ACRDZ8_00920 [Acidimicrobiales bacterium]
MFAWLRGWLIASVFNPMFGGRRANPRRLAVADTASRPAPRRDGQGGFEPNGAIT